ncbi:MAG: ATP-binding protein [Nanoarchaeota archaeon]|nr:ATP-binding protein [Nanoarchaeota archaeon]MBU1030076.1 ATP-binding protein [Nanoarchaeota archaeon]MBU1850653.1 ATP-binding protein [Nanoarchaeota archaeon]
MGFFRLLLPLSKRNKRDLSELARYLEKDDLKKVKRMLKQKKIGFAYRSLNISQKLISDTSFPFLNAAIEDSEISKTTDNINSVVEQQVRAKKYKEFSEVAYEKIKGFIAPNIVGMDFAKEAAMLQLFAVEKVHLLLLGDPGTGKTEILRSVNELAPISSFGLGSGISGVGLTVSVQGKEIHKGLLPIADDGVCCIDELNLMKQKDRGALLNAMEKGFITYNKGNKSLSLDARVSVLATANPTGDRFVGKIIDTFKKQIPFDSALLTRFHIIFFIRRPNEKEFANITQKIVSGKEMRVEINDSLFIRDYIEFSHLITVKFDEKLKTTIVDFVARLKKDEDKFLVEINPRTIIGIMRFAKAAARLELRNKVEEKDLKKVFDILEKSLYIKR